MKSASSTLAAALLDRGCKGFPPAAAACRIDEIGARRWNVLAGDLGVSEDRGQMTEDRKGGARDDFDTITQGTSS